jgi:hypothetical protein
MLTDWISWLAMLPTSQAKLAGWLAINVEYPGWLCWICRLCWLDMLAMLAMLAEYADYAGWLSKLVMLPAYAVWL